MCGGSQPRSDDWGRTHQVVNHNNVSVYDPAANTWSWGSTAPANASLYSDILHGTSKHAVWQGEDWYVFMRPLDVQLHILRYSTRKEKWYKLAPLPWERDDGKTFYECLTIDTIDSLHGILLLGT
jgi:hypothetical protein